MNSAPYGTWKSPISSDLIVKGAIGLSSPSLLHNGICWIESRPQEGGRSVLVEQDQEGNVRDVTPSSFNIRTRVHEYGCEGRTEKMFIELFYKSIQKIPNER